VSPDELMDVASEPHEFSIYTATNFSALTQDITNRLTDTVCNSKHSFTIIFSLLCICVKDANNLRLHIDLCVQSNPVYIILFHVTLHFMSRNFFPSLF